VQNTLHLGRIRSVPNKPHCLYIVSTQAEIKYLIERLNGLLLLKTDRIKTVCSIYNIPFKYGNYDVLPFDPYFAGLVDSDGSIVFNFTSNRIECCVELKASEDSIKLNFNHVIPHAKPSVAYRKHQSIKKVEGGIEFDSICFKYQNVAHILPLYDYFMKNRLFCDFKFYRVAQIPKFLEIRHFASCHSDSLEYKRYSQFILS
jgi:hypothetical protein